MEWEERVGWDCFGVARIGKGGFAVIGDKVARGLVASMKDERTNSPLYRSLGS